jgi:hypothetical protein
MREPLIAEDECVSSLSLAYIRSLNLGNFYILKSLGHLERSLFFFFFRPLFVKYVFIRAFWTDINPP